MWLWKYRYLFDTQEEYKVDRETRELSRQKLTTTTTIFLDEMSENLILTQKSKRRRTIPTSVQFCTEKVIKALEKRSKMNYHWRNTQRQNSLVHLQCLIFVDDIDVIYNNRQEAVHSMKLRLKPDSKSHSKKVSTWKEPHGTYMDNL